MLSQKELSVLQDICRLYEEMYAHREIFEKKYFKYEIEELRKILDKLTFEDHKKSVNKKGIRNSILALHSTNEVRNFYEKYLNYDHSSQEAKKKCIKSITLQELTYLYNIIYSSPLRSNVRKNEVLDLIEKYFEGIDRALNMKP